MAEGGLGERKSGGSERGTNTRSLELSRAGRRTKAELGLARHGIMPEASGGHPCFFVSNWSTSTDLLLLLYFSPLKESRLSIHHKYGADCFNILCTHVSIYACIGAYLLLRRRESAIAKGVQPFEAFAYKYEPYHLVTMQG